MGLDTWSLTAKLCDSCKTTSATVFCRADSAFLCLLCDSKIHAANKLASRHARVWVCEVCEQAPASVTCKADAAALCVTCDNDIHSANPLARRHERVPVVPFYDSNVEVKSHGGTDGDDDEVIMMKIYTHVHRNQHMMYKINSCPLVISLFLQLCFLVFWLYLLFRCSIILC